MRNTSKQQIALLHSKLIQKNNLANFCVCCVFLCLSEYVISYATC